MKKTIFLVAVIMICNFAACGKEAVHYGMEAKTIGFSSLEEMEDFSDVIVRGVRQPGEEARVITENGNVVSAYSFSEFEVTEVIKDDFEDIEKGSVITILENEAYNQSENEVYHIAGYNMMVEGKEYLLFLRKNSLNGSVYYVSAGINYGTVSLQEDNRTVNRLTRNGNMVTDFSYYEGIWEDAIEKYVE